MNQHTPKKVCEVRNCKLIVHSEYALYLDGVVYTLLTCYAFLFRRLPVGSK